MVFTQKNLHQIITKVCKFTRNTAITQKYCPNCLRKCASLLEIQQFGCISSKIAHFCNYLGQFLICVNTGLKIVISPLTILHEMIAKWVYFCCSFVHKLISNDCENHSPLSI